MTCIFVVPLLIENAFLVLLALFPCKIVAHKVRSWPVCFWAKLFHKPAYVGKLGSGVQSMARNFRTSVPLRSDGMGGSEENKNLRIVWVDLEMSGLDPDQHTILEMACVVTDNDLNVVAEAPNMIVHHPASVREEASEWCQNEFAKSGLWEEVEKSQTCLADVEKIMLDFLKQNVIPKKSPLAGNSIYMDRLFLRKYMPAFEDYLHYRIVDVSSIKELSKRWYPNNHYKQPKKKLAHRALSDVQESIEELKWYRANVFRNDGLPEAKNSV